MIEVIVYRNGSKIKGKAWKSPDGTVSVNNRDIFDIIREFPDDDLKVTDIKNKKDMTYETLLNLIMAAEKEHSSNLDNLNEIIRAGGFVDYINSKGGRFGYLHQEVLL